MKKLRVVQFGLGPIGLESVRLAASHGAFEIVGGIDIDPAKVGRTLAELTGLPGLGNARIHASFAELFAAAEPDVVLHTASSSAAASLAQLRPALDRGLAVVSTCEELIFPALKTPELALEYDDLCRRTGARVAATGVNPGFVMDILPLCLTGVSRTVESIYVERVVDATTRRQPLQAKIGSGQDPEGFRAKFRAGQAGHAGFKQSVALVAHAMGWKLDEVRESCEPVVAVSRIVTPFFDVAPGQSCGIHQRCLGLVGGHAKLKLQIPGGVAGDDATVAALINAVVGVLHSAPGLRLATELPVPHWRNPLS
jgi:4-hydroxy-tetrahydrodipicolinate reductase